MSSSAWRAGWSRSLVETKSSGCVMNGFCIKKLPNVLVSRNPHVMIRSPVTIKLKSNPLFFGSFFRQTCLYILISFITAVNFFLSISTRHVAIVYISYKWIFNLYQFLQDQYLAVNLDFSVLHYILHRTIFELWRLISQCAYFCH